MDDQTNYVLIPCLDTETKFDYLNYYVRNMLAETNDE